MRSGRSSNKRMEAILEVKDLRISFEGEKGFTPVVNGVNLAMEKGKILALVGESGCGKTALCRCLMGISSRHARIDGGSILLEGRERMGLSEKEWEKVRGREIAMILQDPMTSLNPVFSVGDQIAETIRAHEKVSRKEARQRAVSLLELVEIPNAPVRARQYPHQFSGGMRQRVAIAIALAANPKVILADEPTTSLDIHTQTHIMTLLKKVCVSQEKSLLFVTHDLGLAENMADYIAVMKDGVVVESGETENIFAHPVHEYTKKLLGFAAYGKGSSHFHGHILEEKPEEREKEKPLVQVRNLTKSFEVRRGKSEKFLEEFNLDIYTCENIIIVGSSGCGKSTLARCLMGIYPPDQGEIRYNGECRKQMIFQDSASAFNPRMTVKQIIGEPLMIARYGSIKRMLTRREAMDVEEKILQVARQVDLTEELLERHPYDISGGQRQRAAIARALITDPDFLIADEPISSLDIPVQSQIIHLLKNLHDSRGLTMMIIAHDLPMVKHVSDRIIEM